ncbi:hypothetical protein B0H10DRAFT_2196471 [Mycena sp. CBHHK59/15]|nr:hypothetical protein B0H10DRAFT_2196471 [Mycena sp. CBHHK59/15]
MSPLHLSVFNYTEIVICGRSVAVYFGPEDSTIDDPRAIRIAAHAKDYAAAAGCVSGDVRGSVTMLRFGTPPIRNTSMRSRLGRPRALSRYRSRRVYGPSYGYGSRPYGFLMRFCNGSGTGRVYPYTVTRTLPFTGVREDREPTYQTKITGPCTGQPKGLNNDTTPDNRHEGLVPVRTKIPGLGAISDILSNGFGGSTVCVTTLGVLDFLKPRVGLSRPDKPQPHTYKQFHLLFFRRPHTLVRKHRKNVVAEAGEED